GEGASVVARLRKWAVETPDRRFFFYGEDGTSLSFRQFNEMTDRIAGNLAARGIKKGDRIAILTRNQKLSVLSMFAVWKAGAVFCPINFNYTGVLLHSLIQDINPSLLIADDEMKSVIEDAARLGRSIVGIERIVIDGSDPSWSVASQAPGRVPVQESWSQYLGPSQAPSVDLNFDDIANIIYTSGTTGPSKGALQTHRWINQMTFFLRKLLTPDDVIYNDLPIYHIGGAICNVARAAWVGCEVACWDRFSVGDFWDRIETSSASCAILLDVMIPRLMKAPASVRDRNNTLNKVNLQPLPLNHNEIARRFGFDVVATGFGQTESGNSLVAYILETDEETETPSTIRRGMSREGIRRAMETYGATVVSPSEASWKGFMGRETMFVDATILDEHDQECEPGEAGQLAIRPKVPALLFSGYHGRPEDSLKSIRNFWFHTGDVARKEPSGIFTYIDRMADRIRVRGENVSSFQIEDIFNQNPSINICAAFPVPALEGDEDDVVVYVVPSMADAGFEQRLQDWIKSAMPKFMQPKYIRIVDDIPRTPTNKIEKFKLKKMFLEERANEMSSAGEKK
ncbi:MAG: AMP-binding protein, partial [Pseudomonadota bacterium]